MANRTSARADAKMREMRGGSAIGASIAIGVMAIAIGRDAHGELPIHSDVRGREVSQVSLDGHMLAWEQLEQPIAQGVHIVGAVISADATAIAIPVCAGRGRIMIDGATIEAKDPGPLVVPLAPRENGAGHDVAITVSASGYERRIACGAPLRVASSAAGDASTETSPAIVGTKEGLSLFTFASPHAHAGGGRAVVYVPPGHDAKAPGALLVGAHPWNGGIWTYAAYAELLREAAARDVLLLMPSGLGNSLYTADAEDEVMRAIDALGAEIAVDPRRVSIWGASMGGAGATTIGLHHPDRFASITSFFGDAKYDLATYVKSLLPNETAAHRVNAIDVVDNARHVPIWLIHGESDRVSPIFQSEVLAQALEAKGFAVRFDRAPGMGHEGALVARFIREVVARAHDAKSPEHPARVTFRSVRASDVSAYGVRIERAGSGDAFVDVERRGEGVRVIHATGVRAIVLAHGALGATEGAPIVVDAAAKGVRVSWEAR